MNILTYFHVPYFSIFDYLFVFGNFPSILFYFKNLVVLVIFLRYMTTIESFLHLMYFFCVTYSALFYLLEKVQILERKIPCVFYSSRESYHHIRVYSTLTDMSLKICSVSLTSRACDDICFYILLR